MEDQIKGQMTIDMFLDAPEPLAVPEPAARKKVDFSCFSSKRRRHPNAIVLGKCPFSEREKWDRKLNCQDCEAYNRFYSVADDFRERGFKWNQSVELSKKYFGIESAYENALSEINVDEVLKEYKGGSEE
mgnify:CR=1 FL=1